MASSLSSNQRLFLIEYRKPSLVKTKQAVPFKSTHPRLRVISRSSSGDKKESTLPEELTSRRRDPSSGDGVLFDILSIALPAAVALAAEPLTSLADTAFVGHIGSVELAAVGVSASVYNLVSKLFNVPLLNITTSFVAEDQASPSDARLQPGSKILLPAVSTSLALAAGLGLAEAVALSLGSGFLMTVMGISPDSPMRSPAEQYLTLRAFGTVPIVIALAAQGTFRGFKDTKTPLYAVGAGNIVNCVLDPIFIFYLDLGVGGAAIATVISEFLTAVILMWKLNEKVSLVTPNINGGRIARYLRSGALLTLRSLAVLVTLTLATSMAAREGPIPMAGYQICIEIWLALSLLNDALALAGQALLATDYSQGNYNQARKVVFKVLQIGLLMGGAMALILFVSFGALSELFSTDSDVLQASRSATLFVAGTQPINAVAFVLDGLYYGVSDFEFAAYSMLLIGTISSLLVLAITPFFGINGVWTGLFLFMTLRVVAGTLRLNDRKGPWRFLWLDSEEEKAVLSNLLAPTLLLHGRLYFEGPFYVFPKFMSQLEGRLKELKVR